MSVPPLQVLTPAFRLIYPADMPWDGTTQHATDGGGQSPYYSTTWGGTLFVDLEDALVESATPFVRGVTKINVSLSNVLRSSSEEGTVADVHMTDFEGLIITVNIPEPATAALCFPAITVGLFASRRGRM